MRTNTTNEKAPGRESKGFKNCATNVVYFNAKERQLHLDLDDQPAPPVATPAAPPARPRLMGKPLPGGKPRTKLETVLRQFLLPGRNFNRFEAEDFHDHCLHSTVSTLQNGYGLKIEREFETVPCLRGRSSVRCKRYWLNTSPDNIAAARLLLSMLGRA